MHIFIEKTILIKKRHNRYFFLHISKKYTTFAADLDLNIKNHDEIIGNIGNHRQAGFVQIG